MAAAVVVLCCVCAAAASAPACLVASWPAGYSRNNMHWCWHPCLALYCAACIGVGIHASLFIVLPVHNSLERQLCGDPVGLQCCVELRRVVGLRVEALRVSRPHASTVC